MTNRQHLFQKYLKLEKQAEARQSLSSATSEDIRAAWEKADKAYQAYLDSKKGSRS